jgi:uncharacterized FAD-dependent dehydrogenase
MENKYKIIFVGAGVSNLVAANRLLDYSINDFIIIEQGNQLDDRKCEGEKLYSCKKCSQGCSTLEGVGGANALHGNKMCYFPASDKISKSFSSNEINCALSFIQKLAFPYFDLCYNSKNKELTNKKYYNSDVLNKQHFNNLIKQLTDSLRNKIRTNTEVNEIIQTSTGYKIKTILGHEFLCEKLVIGTGRSSYRFLKSQFDNLGIEYNSQTQDIGIRIEAHKDCFSEDYYYQVDPKFKYNWSNIGSGRTFCAHNQGKVVPVRFGDSFFADGAFGAKFGKNNNIALMVRTPIPLMNEELESWCSEINKRSNNKLILGEIMLNQSNEKIVSEILKIIPLFPTESHKKLMVNLLNELFLGSNKILHENRVRNAKLKIYGPAIDRQWVTPSLAEDFSVGKNKNLYIVGDAIGKSRGFVQAMFSGAIWADRLNNNKFSKTKVEWLNLV